MARRRDGLPRLLDPERTPAEKSETAHAAGNRPARVEIRGRLDGLVGDLHNPGLVDGAVVVGNGCGDVVRERRFG